MTLLNHVHDVLASLCTRVLGVLACLSALHAWHAFVLTSVRFYPISSLAVKK